MAENIGKLYPPTKEDYKPFSWYGDSEEKRYERIIALLSLYEKHILDMHDLNWLFKNALVSKIYISQKVKDLWDSQKPLSNPRHAEIFEQIQSNGYADEFCMDIRKYTKELKFEHVVPGNVYMFRIVELYENGQLTFERFKKIRQKINVCIITTEEERHLDHKWRFSMPNDDWENGNEFARYDELDPKIKIFRR